MGSKANAVKRTKRKLICPECSTKFANRALLQKHILKMHKKQANNVVAAKENKNMSSFAQELEEKPITPSKNLAITSKKVKPNKSVPNKTQTSPQIESKCHVCRKLFKSRIEMLNHYRESHLPSPRIVETKADLGNFKHMTTVQKATQDQSRCVTCSKIFATRKSMLLHVCKNIDGSKEQYRCSGCKKKFRTLDQVDAHIVTDHDDKMEVLVFNDEIEFETWKKKEQNKTRVRYTTMSDADSSNKVFRCAAVIKGDAKDNLKDMCPATIILRSDNNLLKATFYKKHYGHPHREVVSEYEDTTQSGTELDTSKISLSSNMDSCTELETKHTQPENIKIDSDMKLRKCLGCCQTFKSIKNLHLHLSNVHSDDMYSILIPSDAEFHAWKANMERMTNTRYSAWVKYDQKIYYSCTAVFKSEITIGEKGLELNVKRVCPSTIITKLYSSGIQVHFYKIHYGHEHKQYVPTNDVKKYDIKSMLQYSSPERSYSRKNLDLAEYKMFQYGSPERTYARKNQAKPGHLPGYKKLKSMLLGVLSTAEFLQEDKIGLLLAEAEEITKAAKTLMEEDRKEKQKLAEIERKERAKTLMEENRKEKQKAAEIERKERAKTLMEEDRKEKQKAAEIEQKEREKKITANTLKRKIKGDDLDTEKIENLRTSKRLKGRPSIDTSSPAKVTPVINTVKKVIQKTKSPAIITTNIPITKPLNIPKIVNTFTLATEAQTEVKAENQTDDKESLMNGTSRDENENRDIDKDDFKKTTPIISKKYEPLQTLSSFNDSYKTFIESKSWATAKSQKEQKSETSKGKVAANVKKNNKKMKTKLGQFSPKVKSPVTQTKSPIASPSPVKISTPPVLGKIKVERYEVKERENDCNILILKI